MRHAAPIVFAIHLVATLPAGAQEPVPPGPVSAPPLALSTETAPEQTPEPTLFDVPHESRDQRTLLDRWTGRSTTTWADSLGFQWQASGGRVGPAARPPVRPTLATDPAWRFGVSATRDGPVGLRFTGRVGGRRGYGVPSRLTDVVGGDRTIELAGSQLLDPTQPDTIWDATLRVEGGFEAGDVEIRLVGEGLVSFGRAPLSTGSPPAGSEWRRDPQHLTGRAVRLGLVFDF